jgi:hypothetical protein
MLNFKRLKEMKKVILFFVVALAFASCAPKAAEESTDVDTTVIAIDTIVVDTTVIDTVAPAM